VAIEVNVANGDRSTVLDLYHGTLKIVGRTWQTGDAEEHTTKKARGEYGADVAFSHFLPVMESFQLVGAGTSSQLRAEIRRLQDAIEGARKYRTDPLEDETWWWEVNAAGEPARRSFIYRGSLQPAAEPTVDPFLRRPSMKWQVALERHPFFEPLTPSTFTATGLSTFGEKFAYSGVPGIVPARISQLLITGTDIVHPVNQASTVWVGFRPAYYGTAEFEPVWPLAEGGLGAFDESVEVDATTFSGERVTVTFATTPGWAFRVAMNVFMAATYYSHTEYTHYKGRYLVLGRVKVSAANTTVSLRIDAAGVSGETFITNTAWRTVPLGHVQIPRWGGVPLSEPAYYASTGIWIYAKRVEGAGHLHLDCLTLIPQPYAATLWDVALNGPSSVDEYLLTLPDDRQFAYGFTAPSSGGTTQFAARSCYLPPGDGIMVVAADHADGPEPGAELNVGVTYYPRWKSYREDTT